MADGHPEVRTGVWPSGKPPVIILGGGANALSIARTLGRRGIAVYAINHEAAHVRYSRFCRWLEVPQEGPDPNAAFLLGPASDHLRGAVLLAAGDDALEWIAEHREALAERYRLDLSNAHAQQLMLNKLATYQAAREAGVPTPKFWTVETVADVERLRDELVFPLLVKPVFSHLFQQKFKAKFLVAHSYQELVKAFEVVQDARIEAMLVEMIPGPDTLLCSYYTYLDEAGTAHFDFTKRVIRRYPANMGIGTYHITDWNPEVKEVSLKLFRHVGLLGLANAEFKRDTRDGKLKLIECNARFTAANVLVAASGFDLALFVYSRLAGQPTPELKSYRSGVRMLDPVRDYRAFLELKRAGELTFAGWIASLVHPQVWAWFQWDDPLPSLTSLFHSVRKALPRRPAR